MTLEIRSTDDLCSIAAAGGGFRLNVGIRSAQDLREIAASAVAGNARLIFTGIAVRTTLELRDIAAAGQGHVSFEN